jgi:shikimate 5-dehydrogenase
MRAVHQLVFDAVDTPLETRLLREAKAAGVPWTVRCLAGQAAKTSSSTTTVKLLYKLMRQGSLASERL